MTRMKVMFEFRWMVVNLNPTYILLTLRELIEYNFILFYIFLNRNKGKKMFSICEK